jgi:hypothetical protein
VTHTLSRPEIYSPATAAATAAPAASFKSANRPFASDEWDCPSSQLIGHLPQIFRTVVEEIIVRSDAEVKTLQFTIHWKGGTHTQLTMERPRSATETATPAEALEIIRRMAVRHGDDQIASVLIGTPKAALKLTTIKTN